MKKRERVKKSIDLEKLRCELGKTGKPLTAMSREMGYAATYLHHVLGGETPVSVTLSVLLKSLYGINVEDCAKEQSEEKEEPKTGFSDEEKNELYKIIYVAVYEAVKKAWSE